MEEGLYVGEGEGESRSNGGRVRGREDGDRSERECPRIMGIKGNWSGMGCFVLK